MDRLRYLLGVVTLAVMAIGGWLVYGLLQAEDVNNQYLFEVSFLDARGVKPGADVKYRGVRVGSVRRIKIATSEPAQSAVRSNRHDTPVVPRSARVLRESSPRIVRLPASKPRHDLIRRLPAAHSVGRRLVFRNERPQHRCHSLRDPRLHGCDLVPEVVGHRRSFRAGRWLPGL